MDAAAQTLTIFIAKESKDEIQQQRIAEKEALELWGAGAGHPPNIAVMVYCLHV